MSRVVVVILAVKYHRSTCIICLYYNIMLNNYFYNQKISYGFFRPSGAEAGGGGGGGGGGDGGYISPQ